MTLLYSSISALTSTSLTASWDDVANATGYYWLLSTASTWDAVAGANTKADGLFDVSDPESYASLTAGTWTIAPTGLTTIPDGTYYLYVYAAGDGISYADSPAAKSGSRVLSSSRVYTYTFNSASWGATESVSSGSAPGITWTSGKNANLYSGYLQVSTGVTGANATTSSSFSNVSRIVVNYHTNASNGAGSIAFKIGSNSEVSKSVTKTGGTTSRTLEYNFSPSQSGVITITATCTTNSIYIESVVITAN